MPHKRYQSPYRGYSRRQQKAMAELAIEEQLEFEEQVALTRFGEETITSLMARADGGAPPGEPIEIAVGERVPPAALAMTMSELMADPTDGAEPTAPGDPEPSPEAPASDRSTITTVVRGSGLHDDRPVPAALERTPERAPVTHVVRGGMVEPAAADAANPQIARLDRLLAAIRRDR